MGDDENHNRREYKKPSQVLNSGLPLEARVNGFLLIGKKNPEIPLISITKCESGSASFYV